jgi:hypothetical protein
VSDQLITVLLVQLMLTELMFQIVIVILLSIDTKTELSFVQHVTKNVMFVLEKEITVILVELLELIVMNQYQNHAHVLSCIMKTLMKDVLLVTGDVPIVILITKMDNYVVLVLISELETVVSVQLKVISLMTSMRSLNVNNVIASVLLVMDMLQVTV